MSDLGNYIRSRRESMGLGLRQTAEKAGFVPAYLSDIERGYRQGVRNKSTLDKIANAINIPESEMLNFYILALQENELAKFVIDKLQQKN